MNKLKIILEFFKKYLFWFISASTVIVVLIFWWWSTATLAKDFNNQQTIIQGKFSKVEAIDGDREHPTPEYTKAVNDKHDKLKEGVLAVWKTLYDEQKEKNPWPKVLGDDFKKKIEALGPEEEIPDNLREKYQNIIKEYFPQLFKIVDVRHFAETAEGMGKGGNEGEIRPRTGWANLLLRPGMAPAGRSPVGAAAENTDIVGVVVWDESDQQRLKDRFDWKTRPESFLIRLRQEDLWVYETLLQVIAKTNEGATEHSQANVKRIEWIRIGADAIETWSVADQSVFRTQTPAAVTVAGRPETRSMPTGREGGAVQESKEQLLKERYVDDKGAPLDAEAKHPYAEFKMMPISMKLHMDQRKISKLLVECVNRSMPIEVRRVRIRPGEGEILEAGATGAGTPGANLPVGRGADSMRGRMIDRGASTRYGRAGMGPDEGELGPFDIPVEIQGIIYIYNPPDLSKLGTGTAVEKPAEAVPVAAPAASPAAEGGAGAPAKSPEAAPAKTPETTPAAPPGN